MTRTTPAAPSLGRALAAVGGGVSDRHGRAWPRDRAHWPRGPTLLGRGSVPAEEEVLTVVAAASGWRVAARRRRAWFLPAEPVHRDVPGHAARGAQRVRAR